MCLAVCGPKLPSENPRYLLLSGIMTQKGNITDARIRRSEKVKEKFAPFAAARSASKPRKTCAKKHVGRRLPSHVTCRNQYRGFLGLLEGQKGIFNWQLDFFFPHFGVVHGHSPHPNAFYAFQAYLGTVRPARGGGCQRSAASGRLRRPYVINFRRSAAA